LILKNTLQYRCFYASTSESGRKRGINKLFELLRIKNEGSHCTEGVAYGIMVISLFPH